MLWRPGEYRSCTTPRLVKDVGYVACNDCVNCGKGRQKDLIGRSLIEERTADYTLFATLTIGGKRLVEDYDDETLTTMAVQFAPREVRGYVKRMRRFIEHDWKVAVRANVVVAKYLFGNRLDRLRVDAPVEILAAEKVVFKYLAFHKLAVLPGSAPKMRYVQTGERGDPTRTSRCHYHMLLYFYGCRGPMDLQTDRFMFHGRMPYGTFGTETRLVDPAKPDWKFERVRGIDWVKSDRLYWPFGMVKYEVVDEANVSAAYYVCKYAAKSVNDGDVMRVGISRRPLLGGKYLTLLAQSFVDACHAPQDHYFVVPRNEGYLRKSERKPRDAEEAVVMALMSRPRPAGKELKHNPEYWLSEAGVRYLCREFRRLWAEACLLDPTRSEERPKSELVEACEAWDEEYAAEKERIKEGRRTVRDQVEEEFAAVEWRKRAWRGRAGQRDIDDVEFKPVARFFSEMKSQYADEERVSDFRREVAKVFQTHGGEKVNRYRKLKDGENGSPLKRNKD